MYFFLALSVWLSAQVDEPLITNSGEQFEDPFADPDLGEAEDFQSEDSVFEEGPAEQPVETDPFAPPSEEPMVDPDVLNTESQSLPEPAEDPFAAPPADQPIEQEPLGESPFSPEETINEPEAPNPFAPEAPLEDSVFESPQAPAIVPEPKFAPKKEEGFGPVSEEFLKRKQFGRPQTKNQWSLSFDTGLALDVQNRENQAHFEFEGGYGLSERLELKAALYYRFVKDRLLGFLIMPSYRIYLSEPGERRWEWQPALGIGWTLQGVSGSDFQIGLFPIRFANSFVFYAMENFALTANLDLETYVYRTETGGESEFRFDDPLAQAIVSVGVRYDL